MSEYNVENPGVNCKLISIVNYTHRMNSFETEYGREETKQFT
jgi:hypothetical protein